MLNAHSSLLDMNAIKSLLALIQVKGALKVALSSALPLANPCVTSTPCPQLNHAVVEIVNKERLPVLRRVVGDGKLQVPSHNSDPNPNSTPNPTLTLNLTLCLRFLTLARRQSL